jgi:hypothetical protein
MAINSAIQAVRIINQKMDTITSHKHVAKVKVWRF